MERGHTSVTLTIAPSGNESTPLATHQYAGGIVHMPAAWTSASLGFKVASEVTGTFLPLYDEYGSLVQITPSASRAYNLPEAIFAARYIKLWSQNGSGTNTAQEAARSLIVDLKA